MSRLYYTQIYMKKVLIFVVTSLIFGLIIGFFLGMEYKAYQVGIAIREAFNAPTTTPKEEISKESNTVMEKVKKENMQIIEKNIGDEVVLSALKFKVIKAEEKQTISSSYGGPKTAKEGAKLVIVTLSVTNITDAKFTFFPDDGFILVDNLKREFTTYPDTIGSIDNYLNSRDLPPSITETGVIVYEIPTDATSYSILTNKVGTKIMYKLLLK